MVHGPAHQQPAASVIANFARTGREQAEATEPGPLGSPPRKPFPSGLRLACHSSRPPRCTTRRAVRLRESGGHARRRVRRSASVHEKAAPVVSILSSVFSFSARLAHLGAPVARGAVGPPPRGTQLSSLSSPSATPHTILARHPLGRKVASSPLACTELGHKKRLTLASFFTSLQNYLPDLNQAVATQ